MRRAARIVLLTATILAVPACGGAESDGEDGESIAAAVRAWKAADTGSFEHVTRYTESDDGPKQVISGEYELSANQARSARRSRDSRRTLRFSST